MGAAAACHALLPSCGQESPCYNPSCKQRNKYVDCIIPEMIKHFTEKNIDAKEIEVKLFGGADMFKSSDKASGRVGSMNVEMARKVLEKYGLSLRSFDVGGTQGRKLLFDTRTGEVWMKRLNQSMECLLSVDDVPTDSLARIIRKR